MTTALTLPDDQRGTVTGALSDMFADRVAIVYQRQQARGPLLAQLAEVTERYNGDYAVPDPAGLSAGAAPLPPLTPAIIQEAIDAPAMRAASVRPMHHFPALNAANETGRHSLEWARRRKKAVSHVYHRSHMNLLWRRAFRQLQGYSSACFIVTPDWKLGIPKVEVRDAMGAFPEPRSAEDICQPSDCGFIYGRSAEWLRARFPQSRMENGGPIPEPKNHTGSTMWDVLEWIDEDWTMLGVMGPRYDEAKNIRHGWTSNNPTGNCMLLAATPTRAGTGVVIPQQISLDRVISRVANVVGSVDIAARLMALEIRATEKSIYPDRYIIGSGQATPKLVGGNWKDGMTGEVNIILDANSIGELRSTPDPMGWQAGDRLERNIRVSAGLNPQYGGETQNALRTGRGLETMAAFSMDPRIQELHEIAEYTLEYVNHAILDCYEGYWPDKKFTIFSGLQGDFGHAEFIPSRELAESHENVVAYPLPGSDARDTTIQLGQMVGMKAISLRTFRRKHPMIDDADAEERLILEQEVDELLKMAVVQRLQQGMELIDGVRVRQLIREGKEFDEALNIADAEAKERQAEQAAADPMMDPAMMQPGLSNPGEMALPETAPSGPIPGPAAGLDNVRQLVRATAVRPRGYS